MKLLRIVIVVATALVALFSQSASHATTRARFRAETILNDPSVRISAGGRHTCQVKEDGTVRCWGANDVGQLGNGTTSTGSTAVPVSVIVSSTTLLTSAVAVAAGSNHTCALLDGPLANGTVRCWGLNGNGQIGDGTATQRLTPVAVSGLSGAVAIAAGGSHTCALLAGGTVRCWGANSQGQLGDGTITQRLTPVAVITSPGVLLTNVVAIAAGGSHTCALRAGGTVRCWGANFVGQLGDGTLTSRTTADRNSNLGEPAVAIAAGAGSSHTCALLADSTGLCWGANNLGQIGDGTTINRNSPVPISPLTFANAVAITVGGSHTCALLGDGTGKCWGANNTGQIGDNTSGGTRLIPVAVNSSLSTGVAITAGNAHTCAVIADGLPKCWGLNASGQVGNGTSVNVVPKPEPVLGGTGSVTARDIAAGRNHTCAVRANGTVACWGSNDSGQIGNGTIGGNQLQPFSISNLTLGSVVAIAAGEAHTCALIADGTVKCWGLNSSGQLGDNGVCGVRCPTPVQVKGMANAVAIAAGGALGASHTCALVSLGTVACWGANGSGQLGTGDTLPSSVPKAINAFENVVSIAAGESHTCALVAVGVPFCWGSNLRGQLGTSPTTNPLLPALVSLDNTVAIAGGNLHTCALRADGSTWCWGENLLGQLGINSTVSQPAPRLVVDTTNALVTSAVAVAGGFSHTCALVADGGARCWGDNSVGQLGNSTVTGSSLTPVTVGKLVGNLATFFSPLLGTVNITTGRRHSCALLVSGGVSCWGENTVGQLGIGSTTNQVSPFTVPSFTLNIDPSVVLEHNDRVSTVTILATCEAGQRLHVEVTLIQGAVSGHGVGSGECTGGLERYPVTVPAQGRDGYSEGAAQVAAVADIHERGALVENQQWTRAVQIDSVP